LFDLYLAQDNYMNKQSNFLR